MLILILRLSEPMVLNANSMKLTKLSGLLLIICKLFTGSVFVVVRFCLAIDYNKL
jgi:hypothetical protein